MLSGKTGERKEAVPVGAAFFKLAKALPRVKPRLKQVVRSTELCTENCGFKITPWLLLRKNKLNPDYAIEK